MIDICVLCGSYVPEGRHVCIECERKEYNMKTISKICKGPFQSKAIVVAEFENEEQAKEFCEKVRYDSDMYAIKSVARNMPGIVSVSHRYV